MIPIQIPNKDPTLSSSRTQGLTFLYLLFCHACVPAIWMTPDMKFYQFHDLQLVRSPMYQLTSECNFYSYCYCLVPLPLSCQQKPSGIYSTLYIICSDSGNICLLRWIISCFLKMIKKYLSHELKNYSVVHEWSKWKNVEYFFSS